MTTYTTKQIETAKRNYNSMLVIRTVDFYSPEFIGLNEAEQRCEYHNNIVSSILSGDKNLERKWKLFYLTEEVVSDQKNNKSKAKKNANRLASADILDPIKKLRKLGEFGKWLNTSGNEFRKQHFNKKYTEKSVESFLQTL